VDNIKEFTGIDAPYEKPENADLVIDTENLTVENTVNISMKSLVNSGYLSCLWSERHSNYTLAN
jgi:adenylylsulfate kinase-like enzyme